MKLTHIRHLAVIVFAALCTAIAASSAHAGTAMGYVQDGLLACWDGIENAGSGIHNSSATKWRDLVAGREFSLTSVTVEDDRMVFAGSGSSYGELNEADTAATFNMAANGTLEVVYASDTGSGNQFILQSTAASGHLLTIWSGDKLLVSNGLSNNSPGFSFTSGAKTNSVTIIYTSAKPTAGYANGNSLSTSGYDYWGDVNEKTTIGTRSSKGGNHFKGAIYCIRVYNRQLSAEEIAANRALDVRRFLQGNPIDDVLDISSSSSACSTPSPAYGGHLGLVEGQQVSVSCGQSPRRGRQLAFERTGDLLHLHASEPRRIPSPRMAVGRLVIVLCQGRLAGDLGRRRAKWLDGLEGSRRRARIYPRQCLYRGRPHGVRRERLLLWRTERSRYGGDVQHGRERHA